MSQTVLILTCLQTYKQVLLQKWLFGVTSKGKISSENHKSKMSAIPYTSYCTAYSFGSDRCVVASGFVCYTLLHRTVWVRFLRAFSHLKAMENQRILSMPNNIYRLFSLSARPGFTQILYEFGQTVCNRNYCWSSVSLCTRLKYTTLLFEVRPFW